MESKFDVFDSLFSEFKKNSESFYSRHGIKKYNEDNDIDVFEIPMPGCSANDVEVFIRENLLMIKGTASESKEPRLYKYMVKDDASKFNAKAKMKNGLLTLSLIPKEEERVRIPVET